MDRIRKALDLARQERGELPRDANPAIKAAEPSSTRLPTPIVYTRTRTIPVDRLQLAASRIIDPAGPDAAAAAFRMLRTQVLHRMEEHGWRALAILSPNANDGKTTTAINLAVSMAADQLHTLLLVDCDLKRPTIASSFGITPEFGLNDILSNRAQVDQCLYHPQGLDRLVLLPTRATMPNSAEALSGPRCRDLIKELRGRYPERLLVFDLPPVMQTDDALALLPLLDCGLVVAAEGTTRREDLLRCMELLRKTPIVGTVLNRATDATSAYG